MNTESKKIIICSDGTGNRGGFGQDSNVYKLYSGIQLHDTGKQAQLTFYDNGVGVNKNKIIRALSGGFGFGFAKNVRDIYEFLAKQYQLGDEIYFFGFSRGAATVRAVTGFIDTCGLIDLKKFPEVENDPMATDDLIRDTFKIYEQRQSEPDKATEFKKNKSIHHADFAVDGNLKIKFLGVWDTVSALGFPKDGTMIMEKLFDVVDRVSDAVFPHRFYNYRLNNQIEFAYQALSLDDERQTFKPRLWRQGRGNIVEQVWFSGSHSNVGGGYPRSGMSNVSLQWMVTKAQQTGLVFQQDFVKQITEQANVLDRLYDSRSGLGAYYRYQPRNIKELATEMGHDTVKIHESVFQRIDYAVAGYAPGNIPENIEIVTTDKPSASQRKEITSRAKRIKKHNEDRVGLLEKANGFISSRKSLYHFFVESTLALLISAFFINPVTFPEDVSVFTVGLSTVLTFILPDFLINLVNYLSLNLSTLFLLLCYFGFLFYLRNHFQNEMAKVYAKARALLK